MFELKHLTAAGIAAALEKAEQYRLLNQPWAAESICWDIAAVDPATSGRCALGCWRRPTSSPATPARCGARAKRWRG